MTAERPSWFKLPEENSLDWPPSYGMTAYDNALFMGLCRTLCIEPAFLIVLVTDLMLGRLSGGTAELDWLLNSLIKEAGLSPPTPDGDSG